MPELTLAAVSILSLSMQNGSDPTDMFNSLVSNQVRSLCPFWCELNPLMCYVVNDLSLTTPTWIFVRGSTIIFYVVMLF